jgi:hypothetical protein
VSILQDTSIQKFKVLNHNVDVILTIFAASTILSVLLLSVISAGQRIASFVANINTLVVSVVLIVLATFVGALVVSNSIVNFLEASIPKFKVPYDINVTFLIIFTVAIINWATETFGILTATAQEFILILSAIVLRFFWSNLGER